ncbi:MAG: TlpA family protein disulfide reductase [Chitinophagales bacterium]|nr:TlpA family protein disulfide reductase [Chitinophagales bacterium]
MIKQTIFLILFLGSHWMMSIGQEIPKVKIGDVAAFIQQADKPLVLNFWSTTCKPCIAEIPYFQEKVKAFGADSVILVLVSLDMRSNYPNKISEFAKARNFYAPIQWLDETNADYFCPVIDSSWSGVIPATLFINNKTGFRYFQEEKIKPEKFEEILRKLVGR